MRVSALCLAGILAAVLPASAAPTNVAVPAFDSVELHRGGEVVVRHGSTPRVTLVDGDLSMTRFSVDRRGKLLIETSCHSDCPQHYRLRVDITMPAIDAAAVSQGGTIRAEGRFAQQRSIAAAVNQGGRVDVRAVPASQVTAAANQGGAVLVTANGALTAAVNQGGSVTYWGKPTSLTRAVSNGGAIHPAGTSPRSHASHDEASITYGDTMIDVDDPEDEDDD